MLKMHLPLKFLLPYVYIKQIESNSTEFIWLRNIFQITAGPLSHVLGGSYKFNVFELFPSSRQPIQHVYVSVMLHSIIFKNISIIYCKWPNNWSSKKRMANELRVVLGYGELTDSDDHETRGNSERQRPAVVVKTVDGACNKKNTYTSK